MWAQAVERRAEDTMDNDVDPRQIENNSWDNMPDCQDGSGAETSLTDGRTNAMCAMFRLSAVRPPSPPLPFHCSHFSGYSSLLAPAAANPTGNSSTRSPSLSRQMKGMTVHSATRSSRGSRRRARRRKVPGPLLFLSTALGNAGEKGRRGGGSGGARPIRSRWRSAPTTTTRTTSCC